MLPKMYLTIDNNNEYQLILYVYPKNKAIPFTDFLTDNGIKIDELRINYDCDTGTIMLPKRNQTENLKRLNYLIQKFL
ncbi:MAG: hypothetical protein ACI392_06555 [Paludibacteraceae bacterium]